MTNCPICNGKSDLRIRQLEGYQQGAFFDIFVCAVCKASFSYPLKSDSKIYDHIYQQTEEMPGYNRYHRYAQLVKIIPNPIKMLASSEPTYWGMYEAIKKHVSKDANILEVGAGLGYLTYSLNKNGYNVTGVDISESAIKYAIDTFGNYYKHEDIFVLAETQKKLYDAVIMTELIEHVPDPLSFIQATLSLLKPGGKLIITTPNKSFYPINTIWSSDIPPVHLFWFTEDSLRHFAKVCNKQISFIDFTEYNQTYNDNVDKKSTSINKPFLDKDGNLLPELVTQKTWRDLFLPQNLRFLISHYKQRHIRKIRAKETNERSNNMCAVFNN